MIFLFFGKCNAFLKATQQKQEQKCRAVCLNMNGIAGFQENIVP